MNDTNFIHTVSPAHNREIRIWMLITAIISSALIMAIVSFGSLQMWTWYTLQKEKKALEPYATAYAQTIAQQEKQKAEKKILHKKLNRLHAKRNNPKTPLNLIQTICTACSAKAQIQAITINKQTCTLTGICRTTDDPSTIVAALGKASDLEHLTITHIKPHNNAYLFEMNGTIKKPLKNKGN